MDIIFNLLTYIPIVNGWEWGYDNERDDDDYDYDGHDVN